MNLKIKPWWAIVTLVLILVTNLIVRGVKATETVPNFNPGNAIVGEQVTLTLPDRYQGGNPMRDLIDLEQQLSSFWVNSPNFATTLEQNADAIALIAIDTQSEGNYPTGVNIIQDELTEGQTFGDYIQINRDRLGEVYQITQDEPVNINGYQGHRLSLNTQVNGVDFNQLIYLTPQQQSIWITTFSFVDQPNFEAVDHSFKDEITAIADAAMATITFAPS